MAAASRISSEMLLRPADQQHEVKAHILPDDRKRQGQEGKLLSENDGFSPRFSMIWLMGPRVISNRLNSSPMP